MTIINNILGNNQSPSLHAGEVFQVWQHLVMRYDIIELTNIFQNFANDAEFKLILTQGQKILEGQVTQLEEKLDKFQIPLPPRPPKSINTPTNTEILRDELMFRTIYRGVQEFISEHTRAILMMQNKQLRGMFEKMLQNEIELTDKLSSYGRMKGWSSIPPAYNLKS